MTLRYPVGISGEVIHLSTAVLRHLLRQRQGRWWKAEAGGQLYARLEAKDVIVELATGPKASDVRTRYSHCSRRSVAQAEVNAQHKSGLHYIGDWHTHPERHPNPSLRDKITMASRVRQSTHALNGMVFIIVGTDAFPAGLSVMVHDGSAHHQLEPL